MSHAFLLRLGPPEAELLALERLLAPATLTNNLKFVDAQNCSDPTPYKWKSIQLLNENKGQDNRVIRTVYGATFR